MTIANPQIALGIPLSDSNFQTPSPTGVPTSGGWSFGTAMLGYLYGMHLGHPTLTDTSLGGADPYGVGRSLYVDVDAGMNGGSQSFIRTPPSHLGMVPSPGEEIIVNFGVALTVKGDMTSAIVTVQLSEYTAAGVLIANTLLGTMTAGDFGATWNRKVFSKDVIKNADTQFFRLLLFVNSGGNGNAHFGIDFVGLGWIPRNTGQNSAFYECPEPYRYSHQSARLVSGSSPVSVHSGFGHWVQQVGRGMQRWQMSMEWELMSQSFRDSLAFFWAAQQGSIGAADSLTAGSIVVANDLGGEPWPLLLLPNRSGVKSALYARFAGEPFFCDIDNKLEVVDDPIEWAGVAKFEELIY